MQADAPDVARFIADLRKGGMSEVTMGSNLRHLRAALAWAAEPSQGLLPKVPAMVLPPPGEAGAARDGGRG